MGDIIKAPGHYVDGRKYEPKDVIRDWGLNFNLGSAVKYISRAGRKGDKLEDLKKARQFLEFEIEAEEKERSKNVTCGFGCICDVLDGKMKFEDVQEVLKPLVLKGVADEVLNGVVDISSDILSDKLRKLVIDNIVERIVDGKLSLLDISCSLFNYIGMSCKEAATIGDSIAKGFENGIKDKEENSDIEIETVNEHMISAYVNGLFYRIIEFNSIPDEYKPIVIDKIAQKVLNNQWNIVRDIPTKELQDMVVDWIIELINNDELDRFDIPAGLYKECGRIREAIADKGYCKALDGIKKYAEDTKDTVSINFEFEVDPNIDTDTVNVHVHIKNKED